MSFTPETSARRHTGETTVLVLSRDESLLRLVLRSCSPPWRVESGLDTCEARHYLSEQPVGVVVIDDELLGASERGWMIDQIHRGSPDALVVYVAARHSAEIEREVRSHRVLYYTSKPVDTERLKQVLSGVVARSSSRSRASGAP